MSKPSQYFLDKSEAMCLKNTLQKHIQDSNIAYKQSRTQSFVSKTLSKLTPNVAVSNPYEQDIMNSEVEASMLKFKKNQNMVAIQDIPIEIQQADAYIQKHSRAFNITDNFSKKLGLEGPKIDLGDVQIAQKREAVNYQGRIELKPTIFELPKTQNFVYSKDPNAYVKDQEDQLELLDNRIPLRVVQVQEYQEAVKQKNQEKQLKVKDNNGTRKTTVVQHKGYKQDHLDFAVNSTFLDKTSERMLKNVQKISNHEYFADGKCRCPCHLDPEPKKRICDICLCKLQKDDTIELEVAQQVQSNNLLKNTNLPLYVSKATNQNILTIDGRLTNNQVVNLIRHQQSQMNPDEKILFIAKQQEFLADKTWSPKLRSDIAPKQKPQELEVKIQNAHINTVEQQMFKIDEMSLQGNIDLTNKNMLEASKALVTETMPNVHLQRRNLRSEEEALRKKIQRVVDNKQILESRKPEISGVVKIVEQSIIESHKHPHDGYKYYVPPVLKDLNDKSNSLNINDLKTINHQQKITKSPKESEKVKYNQNQDVLQDTPIVNLQNSEDFSGYQSVSIQDQHENDNFLQDEQTPDPQSPALVSSSIHSPIQNSTKMTDSYNNSTKEFSSKNMSSNLEESVINSNKSGECNSINDRQHNAQNEAEVSLSHSISHNTNNSNNCASGAYSNTGYGSGGYSNTGYDYGSGYGSNVMDSREEPTEMSQNFSDNQPKKQNLPPVKQQNPNLPPYVPSKRMDSPDKKGPKPKYMQPRTVDRVQVTKHDQQIDAKKYHQHEKFKQLIADPSLPQLSQKQFQKALAKAYDRLENLNEYVELNIIYGDDKVNFNDYTKLRNKHVRSSMK